MRRRIVVISNPVSGRGRARKLAARVIERLRGLGCEVALLETRRAGDARAYAADAGPCDAIGVVGGDGTINEVLHGIPLSGAPPLGIVPAGTANVLAKELGIGRRADRLAALLSEGREISWDLGIDRVGGRRFLLFMGAGYDAAVVHLFHARRRGPIRMWQYLWWGLKSLLGFVPPRIRVELDGRELARPAAWVLASNVRSYGGPLVFTPRAKPDDGTLEVMVLHDLHPRATIGMFWRAQLTWLFGGDLRLGGLEFHRAKRIRLWSADARSVPVQIDGDPGGALPIDVEVKPGAVKILAP